MPDGEPSLEQLVGRAGPPPLRLYHLLSATAVAAVFLTVSRSLQFSNIGGLGAFLNSGYGILWTVASALAVTLVLFGLRWCHKGRIFFDLPGHWLLTINSLGAMVFVSGTIAMAVMKTTRDLELAKAVVFAGFLFLNLALICLGLWSALKVADSLPWRLAFLLLGCQVPLVAWLKMLASAANSSRGDFAFVIPVVLLLLLMVAAASDCSARRTRDWPHWLGVGTQMILGVAAVRQQLQNM